MSDSFGDARLEELKFLSEIEHAGSYAVESTAEGQWRDMLVHIVDERFVNDQVSIWPGKGSQGSSVGPPGQSELERRRHFAYLETLTKILEGRKVSLQLSHKGRLRISELKQALTAGKSREPFGILWERRHFETDLQIAILDAGANSPLSLVCLDMNGLKQINDPPGPGHVAGDMALKAYFHAVAAIMG